MLAKSKILLAGLVYFTTKGSGIFLVYNFENRKKKYIRKIVPILRGNVMVMMSHKHGKHVS